MSDLNFHEIYKSFNKNQTNLSLTAKKLISLLDKGINKDLRIEFAEFLIDISQVNDEKSQKLIKLIAQKIGNHYIEKYQVEPFEAIALKLLESISNDEIFFTRSGLDGHSYITFFLENSHVSEIYAQNCFPDFKILKLFSKLKKLYIDDHESYNFNFDGLSKLTNLEILMLDLIGLKDVEDLSDLANLKSLKELHILSTSITKIKFFNQLKQLEKLSIAGEINYFFQSGVSEIEGLESLVKLKELNLYANKISEIKGFKKLSNLEILDLGGNNIVEIKNLDQLSKLKKLNLKNNEIREIKGLDALTDLEVLDLSNNKIIEIKGLENQRNLKYLNLEKNSIKEIKNLENLTNLEFLGLAHNDITPIPELKLINNQGISVKDPQKYVECCRKKKKTN